MMAVIRRLNYQHLLDFWSVVRTGSLSRACEELALSAPTISAQLRTLEERLGEKLLAKAGRGLIPTEVGRLAMDMLLAQIAGQPAQDARLSCRLVLRQSTEGGPADVR